MYKLFHYFPSLAARNCRQVWERCCGSGWDHMSTCVTGDAMTTHVEQDVCLTMGHFIH